MSFTETLFGGLLIVVVLYFLARRSGLSNYWSVLLSGAIPVLAYLGYSLPHGGIYSHRRDTRRVCQYAEIGTENVLGTEIIDNFFCYAGLSDGVIFIHL